MEATRSVLDILEELVEALGMAWGELTIQVADRQVTLLRQGNTLKPEQLARLPAAAARPAG